jgi:hypothetical protein
LALTRRKFAVIAATVIGGIRDSFRFGVAAEQG